MRTERTWAGPASSLLLTQAHILTPCAHNERARVALEARPGLLINRLLSQETDP
jgi:hypothetical protein